MKFSRQEYCNGLPCPPPGDLPDPGIELVSLKALALAGGFVTTSTSWEAPILPCNPATTGLDIDQTDVKTSALHANVNGSFSYDTLTLKATLMPFIGKWIRKT